MKNNLRCVAACSLTAFILMAGCRSPFGRTKDSNSGPTGSVGGSGQFPVFSNELVTGGGAFEYPAGAVNNLSLNFDDNSNPISKRSIRFYWNGQPGVSDGNFTFAGVSLIHIPVFTADAYNSTPGRDLRAAGYTQVTFYARASLSTFTSVTIEAGGPNPEACMTLSTDGSVDNCGTLFPSEEHLTGVISTAWKAYTMPISKVQQSAIKDIFKATFVFANPTPGSTNPGQGGTLYLDQIFYKP